jgi:hypothetical protein
VEVEVEDLDGDRWRISTGDDDENEDEDEITLCADSRSRSSLRPPVPTLPPLVNVPPTAAHREPSCHDWQHVGSRPTILLQAIRDT